MLKDLIKFVIGVIIAWWVALMFMVFVSLALLKVIVDVIF